MISAVGQSGRVGLSANAGTSSGFSVEYIPVLNGGGKSYSVQLGAYRLDSSFNEVMRWAENKDDAHFLLTAGYVSGSVDVVSFNGTTFTFGEPVEVVTLSGGHNYISKQALSESLSLITIIS